MNERGVDTLRYLGVDYAANGGQLNHRGMKVRKCAGVLKSVWKYRNVSNFQWRPKGACMNVLENKVKNRVDVAKMSCLRSLCGVIGRDKVRNEEIRKRCGLKRGYKWFGHWKNEGREVSEKLIERTWRGRLRRR